MENTMKREFIKVPKGIRYISDWKEYSLNDYQFPHILNKQITGCGYTEYCLRNDMDIILCSPRRILLDNKEDQHAGEVLYVRNELESTTNYDKDINKAGSKKSNVEQNIVAISDEKRKDTLLKMKQIIKDWYYDMKCKDIYNIKPCKILVTYDSYRIVKETLKELGVFDKFYTVIDEMQSVLVDSKFKSGTEIEFLNHLKDVQKVCYVSATPMLDKYLEMIDEFRDLPYFELDWASEDPGRISKPQLVIKQVSSIINEANRIVKSYLDGNYEKFISKDNTEIKEVISNQAVIYVNSVKNICEIIVRNNLTLENCNVLCARTPENEKKVRKAFGLNKTDKRRCIGKVPKKGELHKMFTFCTRTVYLGADFYSTCARSFILSDANIDCLSVDISIDLPQILGRQRLENNPWKTRAELYVKTSNKSQTIEEFKNMLKRKEEKTLNLLDSYKATTSDKGKHDLAEEYQKLARDYNYRDHYVAVNTHSGSDLVPVFNKLVCISDLRTFEIQQIDYRDRFTVFNTVTDSNNIDIDEFSYKLEEFDNCKTFVGKMKLVCNTGYDETTQARFLKLLPSQFEGYYNVLGPERISALSYQNSKIVDEYSEMIKNQNMGLKQKILDSFEIGKRYLRTEIKDILIKLYSEVGYDKIAKAMDLEEYFRLKPCQITNKETGKKDHAFEILYKWEDNL